MNVVGILRAIDRAHSSRTYTVVQRFLLDFQSLTPALVAPRFCHAASSASSIDSNHVANMTSLSSFKNPAAYHILRCASPTFSSKNPAANPNPSYGTLLGSTFFQSFLGGIIAFRALPRAQFSTLQKATFPAYFTLQTVTPLLMILTYPSPLGFHSLIPSSSTQSSTDRLAMTLIGTMLVTGLGNLVYVGPETTRIMQERKHQETRDGKKSYDEGPHSKEMVELNRRFGVLHGVSSLVNLVGFLGMCWYGALLAEGLTI